MQTFDVRPIPATYLDQVRAQGHDDFGNAFTPRVDHEGGAPLRCCLQDAEAGERVALIAYRPSALGGPYAEVGPVFVHAEPCDGWAGDGFPAGLRHRRQLLRAYDSQGQQVDNILVEPGEQEDGIERLLVRPEIAFMHSRSPLAGCFMFAIHRRPV